MFDGLEERTKIYEDALTSLKETVSSDSLAIYDASMRFLKKVCIGGEYEGQGFASIDILEPDEDGVFFV